MNWTKVLGAGVVAGLVVNLADWVMHGFIMRATYERYDVFDREPASPVWFFVAAVLIGIFAAILFAKTRKCWPGGVGGGVQFGFWLGMVAFFSNFYPALVIAGFPYFLSWCWGGISLIDGIIGGAVLALFIKS